MLQVILTPTCRVSGYPRQVIEVETLLRRLRFIWTALSTVIAQITIIPLGTYNTSSWYIFLRDDATPQVHLSSLMTAVCLSLPFTDRFYWLLSWLLLLLTVPFTDSSLLPSLSLISCLILLHTEHHFQLFRCWFNGLIVPLPRAGLLFVERFPRQRSVISVT
jgi:hypothetical protein